MLNHFTNGRGFILKKIHMAKNPKTAGRQNKRARDEQRNWHYSRTSTSVLRLCLWEALAGYPFRYQKQTVTELKIMEKNKARHSNRTYVYVRACLCVCVSMFTIRVQGTDKLCLYIIQINQLLVISPFVQCSTNNTRKEAIEEGLSPWLFSWHDRGWMSASVRRGLENIKGGGNKHLS